MERYSPELIAQRRADVRDREVLLAQAYDATHNEEELLGVLPHPLEKAWLQEARLWHTPAADQAAEFENHIDWDVEPLPLVDYEAYRLELDHLDHLTPVERNQLVVQLKELIQPGQNRTLNVTEIAVDPATLACVITGNYGGHTRAGPKLYYQQCRDLFNAQLDEARLATSLDIVFHAMDQYLEGLVIQKVPGYTSLAWFCTANGDGRVTPEVRAYLHSVHQFISIDPQGFLF